jgi:hypothetical protein
MCLHCLLRLHLGDFVTHVHQLAEPPSLMGPAWAGWATCAHASVMARVAVQHPASGRPVMAQTTQAEATGGLLNPGDGARPVGRDSAQASTPSSSAPLGGPAVRASS